MRTNKFRSWNDIDGCFYYFQDGKYLDENNKEIEKHCFDWSNAEQFTGLNDDSNSEVYKNDILELYDIWDCKYGIVKFKMGSFGIERQNEGKHFNAIGQFYDHPNVCEFTKVRNIHENPELLVAIK